MSRFYSWLRYMPLSSDMNFATKMQILNWDLNLTNIPQNEKCNFFRKTLIYASDKGRQIWFVMKPQWTRALCLVPGFIISFWVGRSIQATTAQCSVERLGFEMFVLCGLDINMKYELENCLICLAPSWRVTQPGDTGPAETGSPPSVMRRGYDGPRPGLKCRSLLIHCD